MKLWKVLGVAGLVGVAASGVVVARAERQRSAYTAEDVRARLRARHAEALSGTPDNAEVPDRAPRLARVRARAAMVLRAPARVVDPARAHAVRTLRPLLRRRRG